MSPTFAVHAGAHKTASTHFQKVLRRNRDLLEEERTALFLPRDLRRGAIPMQKLAAGALDRDPDAMDAARVLFHGEISGASHVVLSDENMLGSAHGPAIRRSGKFYPDGHIRLHRFLSGIGVAEATVFLAVRDPARFVVSSYSQRVISRGYVPFAEFLGDLDVCLLFWSEFIERLSTCPEVGRIVLWRYEDYPKIASRVLEEMLPGDAADMISPSGKVTHSGLSAAAHLKIEMAERDGAGLSPADIRVIRAALPKGDAGPGYMPFEDALLAESAKSYADDLADVADIAGVTFLKDP